MSGDDFSSPPLRKTPSDMLALKPYWGKLTVRNFRGDDGNVGIIRSPVRAIAIPGYEQLWALTPNGDRFLRFASDAFGGFTLMLGWPSRLNREGADQ
jgi:hypothetical protein